MRILAGNPSLGRGRGSWLAVVVFVLLAALGAGCQRRSQPASRPPAYGPGYPPPGYQGQPGYPPPGYQGQPGYPPPGYQGQPGYQAPGYPPPGAPPNNPPPPGPAAPAPPPAAPGPVQNDPINAVDIGWLRQRAQSVLTELVAALPDASRAKVQGIPLFADPTVGEVNAFAACDSKGKALMAITDGLLDIQAHMAQFKATDEVFGTHKLDQYVQLLAHSQQPGKPVVQPGPGFVDASQHVNGQKVQRQHQILEEQLAFVLGHELGHHHLGHTGCANGQGGSQGVTPADLGRALSNAIPVFNQPNEISSDVAGVNNLLTAGQRRQGYRWTEGGALLTLNFFANLDQLTPTSIVFGFERTHPHPLIRIPIVQQTAATFRSTGGNTFPLPFPLPF